MEQNTEAGGCAKIESDQSSSDCANSDSDEGYPRRSSLKKTSTPACFESIATREKHERFFKSAIEILLRDAVFEGLSRQSKVNEWRSPEELAKTFDFDVQREGTTHEELLNLMKDVIGYSVKPGHPHFVNQLFSGLDPYGLIGQWMTDALNSSVYTYEVSPVFTLMEETVLREMRTIVGWKDGAGDGIFCPGGSLANAMAINCARFKMFPDVKKTGLNSLPRLVLYTSEDAHYSIQKMASFMGLGSDNVYKIKTDANSKMCMDSLRENIERTLSEGGVPFLVSATAGTTVMGAFDPIDKIADVCAEYKIWLHVDAAWGGGALMSKKHRYLLKGIERADSVTWNPHKLLAAPQQCSTFLLRHEHLLSEAHSTNATYLFQKDKFYDTKYDTGDKHIQCGRRADVLKFWFMWKAKGSEGFERHIDTVFDNAEYFLNQIKNRDDFELVQDRPECTNICFWYIPKGLDRSKLHQVAPKIKEQMMKTGSMMCTYQSSKGLPNYFRIVFQSSGLTHSDMDYFIEEIVRLGQNICL